MTINQADSPFHFYTAAYLTRICNQRAQNIRELADGICACSDASIFYHVFQTLDRHHFMRAGVSNDFAHWVLTATHRPELAERLASIDIREYLSLTALREDLYALAAGYCNDHQAEVSQQGLEPFYFCESAEVTVPLAMTASSLQEFRDALPYLSHASFYYHFISSRLRLQLRTNDFSLWLGDCLGLGALSDQMEHLDIYTDTLENVRMRVIALLDKELES